MRTLDDAGDVLVAIRVELGERNAPANHGVPIARPREAQHHGSGDGLLLRGEPAVRLFGETGDGAADTARLDVRIQTDRSPVASLPEFQERRREQRQCARLVADLGDERLRQRGLDMDTHP